jgi:hypothetical protein
LQSSAYRGEKATRPQRQMISAQQKRIETLRAAQLANINAAKERTKRDQNPAS